jgi:hypothetical protein
MNVEVLWQKMREFDLKMNIGGRLWTSYAGGEIRTLSNPLCRLTCL